MDIFIKRLQKVLEEKNITQREFARLVGVTEVTISRYLNGERKPRIEIIDRMAEVLNVSTDYLLGREAKPGWQEDEEIDLEEFLKKEKMIMFNGEPLDIKAKKGLLQFLELINESSSDKNTKKER